VRFCLLGLLQNAFDGEQSKIGSNYCDRQPITKHVNSHLKSNLQVAKLLFKTNTIMPENHFKNNLSWTEAHEAFCYQHHICPAAKSFWQWLVRLGEGIEIEPHLTKEFNPWIAKVRGKGYSAKWLKHIFNKLVECRVIRVIKEFNWDEYRLVLRPITWLNPPKKKPEEKSKKLNSTSTLDPSNAPKLVQEVNNNNTSSSSISTKDYEELERRHEILKLCLEHKIYFDYRKPSTQELFKSDIEDIKSALECFIKAGGHGKNHFGKPIIRSPQGWLIDCLRNGYWHVDEMNLGDCLSVLFSMLGSRLPRDYQ
jgi:hypothetical protein